MDSKFGAKLIEQAITDYYGAQDREHLLKTLEFLRAQAEAGTKLIVAVTPAPEPKVVSMEAWKNGAHPPKRFTLNRLKSQEGKEVAVAFTSTEQQRKGAVTAGIEMPLSDLLKTVSGMKQLEGLIINPWGQRFMLPQQTIGALLNITTEQKRQNRIFLDKGDITRLDIECIVNAANSSLLGGGGVDGAIHAAAGPELLEECRKLGGCETGDAKITGGYALKAKHIIHTVGPVYPAEGTEKDREEARLMLQRCYLRCLDLAKENGIHSIAFPAISTGAYGFPIAEAVPIAMVSASGWLQKNDAYGMTIVFSCFDDTVFNQYRAFLESAQKQAAAKQQADSVLRQQAGQQASQDEKETEGTVAAGAGTAEAEGPKKVVITIRKPADDLVLSAVLGCVTGDALGFPVQFEEREKRTEAPVTDMQTKELKDGTAAALWSDDSSMILAALESLNADGRLDYRDVMDKYFSWRMYGEYTPEGTAFDIGNTTDAAIMSFARGIDPLKCGGADERDNGNGSLMRIMPFALLLVRKGHVFEDADRAMLHKASSLTHAHARSRLACEIYSVIVRELVLHGSDVPATDIVQNAVNDVMLFYRGEDDTADAAEKELEEAAMAAHRESVPDYDEIRAELPTFARLRDMASFAALPETEIRSSGYVVDTLEAAVWCFLTTGSYRECVLKAVNLGLDTDTVACVAGGLAGIRYGSANIPSAWTGTLARKDYIEELCRKFQTLWIG